uniref:Integrase catalytic domain-containing protein n=1 Tax=Trichuris muris TaxID=70415 RepID=A0A5S6Q7L0_TRIMR
MAAAASRSGVLQLYHERLGHHNLQHVLNVLKMYGISVTAEENELCEACAYGKQPRKTFGIRSDRPNAAGEVINADVCGPMSITSLGGARYFVVFNDDYRVTFFSSMPFTPEQNGCSERENRTLVECARTMLEAKELPKLLWAEAVATAAYIYNLTGQTPEKGKSPYELWYNRSAPRTDHLRVFGTKAFVYVPQQQWQKWSRKSNKGLLVGYESYDGYRIYVPSQHKVGRTCHMQFAEERLLQAERQVESINDDGLNTEKEKDDSVEVNMKWPDAGTASAPAEEADNDADQNAEEVAVGAETRSLRKRTQLNQPVRFDDYVLMAVETENPKSYAEAMQTAEYTHWRRAMKEEMQSLGENQTWTLVKLPVNKKALNSRWVLRVKTKPDGTVDRYKARLVAKGFAQKYGTDYDETFSSVARFDTVRTILTIAANEGLLLKQFNVKTAFLYGSLEEEIYMKQPEGFDDGSGRVCKLQRSLYGLKQAPRCWNNRFKEFIRMQGLEQSNADPCLFARIQKDRKLIIVIYVDDGLDAGTNNEVVDEFLMYVVIVNGAIRYLGELYETDLAMEEKNGNHSNQQRLLMDCTIR